MISYKKDVLEWQSLSEVKMGRGSPICERVPKKIVEYFKNNIPQRQIAKALQISFLFQSGKVFYGQTSPNLIFLLEITDAVSSGLKRRETFQRAISVQFKSQHLWWYGGA